VKAARQEVLALLVLVVVGLACYLNSFGNQFVWDDHPQVVNNRLLRSWTFAPRFFTTDSAEAYGVPGQPVVRFYRPLWLLLELAEYQVFGPVPFGFHVVNFLLHLANAVLLYVVLRELQLRRSLALLAAALFLCHPAHLETTTFIAGSVALLCQFNMLIALLAFLRFWFAKDGHRRSWAALTVSVVAYGLALLSKEIAVTLPVVLLAAALVLPPREKPRPGECVIAMLMYLLMTASYLTARACVLVHPLYSGKFPWADRPALALRALAGYIALAVAPVDLYPEKTVALAGLKWTLLTCAGAAAAAGLVAAAIWFWKRDARVTFGLAWFVAGYSLISNLVTVNPTFAERWLYWPLPGLLLAGAAAAQYFLDRNGSAGRGVLIGGWCVVAVFTGLTIAQNRVWHDNEVLSETTIRRGGATPLIRTGLALAYMDDGRFEEAETQLREALKIDPAMDTALWAMGACVAARGDVAGATNWFDRARTANPREMRTVASLAWAQEKLGDLTAAEQTLTVVYQRDHDPFIAVKLGNFLYRQSRLAEAERILRECLARDPDFAPAHNSLGTVLFREDHVDDAGAEFRQALRLDSWLAFAHANLAAIADRRGDLIGALQEYNNALTLDPHNAGFYRALATVLDRHGQTNAAARARQKASEIESKQPDIDLLP